MGEVVTNPQKQVYEKEGIKYYLSNNIPSHEDLDKSAKQTLACAKWEMENFEGRISSKVAAALVAHLEIWA